MFSFLKNDFVTLIYFFGGSAGMCYNVVMEVRRKLGGLSYLHHVGP